MKDKGSIYQVFNELAGFFKDRADAAKTQKPAEQAQTPPPEQKQPDDDKAFLDAMKDVKKAPPHHGRVREPARAAPSPWSPDTGTETMDEVLKGSSPFNVVNLPEYMEGYADDVNPLIVEKLRNGEFSVQKVLDLHGLSAEVASEAFHAFLGEAVHARLHCVKIIHGRGLRSPRGPVLKEKLKEWIVRAMHRKWVVAFASAEMADGGPGATTVLLRTRADKKKLHVIG